MNQNDNQILAFSLFGISAGLLGVRGVYHQIYSCLNAGPASDDFAEIPAIIQQISDGENLSMNQLDNMYFIDACQSSYEQITGQNLSLDYASFSEISSQYMNSFPSSPAAPTFSLEGLVSDEEINSAVASFTLSIDEYVGEYSNWESGFQEYCTSFLPQVGENLLNYYSSQPDPEIFESEILQANASTALYMIPFFAVIGTLGFSFAYLSLSNLENI